ncbi:hypothetical protein LAZ40_02325 [Cereibacter sphaeroides]|uniref:hypothetical protein n=1 Tax=Cereibacter sphaeroides TaxID=1063 RepID=UPI001F26FE74|nr:hypothetical protein [Cereibacter sphaeroides]MCE6957894.1 hypothetical protein [Cereibacter sphaeroides]MCE6971758.1 hypothetical protein [Cereibacter sphaeroides]
MSTFLTTVFEASDRIRDGRTTADVYIALLEEYGELIQEVTALSGFSKVTEAGPDGVAGEAIDVALCAIDIYRLRCSGATETRAIFEWFPGLPSTEDSFFGRVLGDAVRPLALEDRLARMGERIGHLAAGVLRPAAGGLPGLLDPINETAIEIAIQAVRLAQAVTPGLDEARLVALARPKLEKYLSVRASLPNEEMV